MLDLFGDGQSDKPPEKARPDITFLYGIGGDFSNRAGVSKKGSENPLGVRCYGTVDPISCIVDEEVRDPVIDLFQHPALVQGEAPSMGTGSSTRGAEASLCRSSRGELVLWGC